MYKRKSTVALTLRRWSPLSLELGVSEYEIRLLVLVRTTGKEVIEVVAVSIRS